MDGNPDHSFVSQPGDLDIPADVLALVEARHVAEFRVTLVRCRDRLEILDRSLQRDFEFRFDGQPDDGHCKGKSLVEHTRNFRRHVDHSLARLEAISLTGAIWRSVGTLCAKTQQELAARLDLLSNYSDQHTAYSASADDKQCAEWFADLRTTTESALNVMRRSLADCVCFDGIEKLNFASKN